MVSGSAIINGMMSFQRTGRCTLTLNNPQQERSVGLKHDKYTLMYNLFSANQILALLSQYACCHMGFLIVRIVENINA